MKTIDLHAHTTASDGSFTPAQLVELAVRKGLAAVAVTDHDTTAGLAQALEAGKRLGIRVVPGIETTCALEDQDIHIVSLFIQPDHPAIQEMARWMSESRRRRNEALVDRLMEMGLPISWEDLKDVTPAQLGRAHMGRILVDRGCARDLSDAIGRYMARGTPGYIPRETPPVDWCIRVTHEAGGLAFVAHINQICRKDPQRSLYLCRKALELGPDGLETRYCEYDDFWQEKAEGFAREFGLLRSGGSDFHGRFKPGLELGTGYGSLAVPLSYLEEMDRFRQKQAENQSSSAR